MVATTIKHYSRGDEEYVSVSQQKKQLSMKHLNSLTEFPLKDGAHEILFKYGWARVTRGDPNTWSVS